jgi:hypothetical protein
VVKEREEIRFDLLSELAGPRMRIAMGIVVALALVGLYGASVKPSFDYVAFMKVEKSSYLKIRMDGLFSIYVVFLVAVIVRYLGFCRGWCAAGNQVNLAGPLRLRLARRAQPARAAGGARSRGLGALPLPEGSEGTAGAALNGMSDYLLLASAVHPGGGVHEQRPDHGPAAALLQRARRALARGPGAGERGAKRHLRQHVGLRARRRGRERPADADADDEGRPLPRSFAAALSFSSVIRPIIPPSIARTVLARLDTSIGCFLAGVSGLCSGWYGWPDRRWRRRNFPVEPAVPLRELPRVTWEAFPALMMPVILFGCLYSGVTTPTEAAAAAAAYALAVSALLYRSVKWNDFYGSLLTSARTTISIGMLIAGALVFNYVITIENVPKALAGLTKGYELSPLAFLLFVNALLLVLGCFLEGTTILLVIVPVLLPTAQALGIDLVHFGVVAVTNIMLGLVTPPYGLLLFMMSRSPTFPSGTWCAR